MQKILNLLKRNWSLLLLLIIAGTFYYFAVALFSEDSKVNLKIELAKSFMRLVFSALAGGLIKIIFEQHEKNKNKEAVKKEFKHSVLNQIRKVFDNVDRARLIIVAHKSAKTYSEKIQQNIIPSILKPFDIKRSQVDSNNMSDSDLLIQLRINFYHMIAYLQVLANEYRDNDPPISIQQTYQEKIKAL